MTQSNIKLITQRQILKSQLQMRYPFPRKTCFALLVRKRAKQDQSHRHMILETCPFVRVEARGFQKNPLTFPDDAVRSSDELSNFQAFRLSMSRGNLKTIGRSWISSRSSCPALCWGFPCGMTDPLQSSRQLVNPFPSPAQFWTHSISRNERLCHGSNWGIFQLWTCVTNW